MVSAASAEVHQVLRRGGTPSLLFRAVNGQIFEINVYYLTPSWLRVSSCGALCVVMYSANPHPSSAVLTLAMPAWTLACSTLLLLACFGFKWR